MNTIEQIYKIYSEHPQIITDTRKLEKDCIFWALKGEKFDANEFVNQALDQGAAYAVISNPNKYIEGKTVLVEDTLVSLQELAKLHRSHLSIPIIVICGSNGKTTTKELTYAALNSHYKTFATYGNLNNHIGVPLSLLSITKDIEVAVIEIGANHVQETYDLCEITSPNYGVITNHGKDHLEGFGSIENVIKANSELFDWFRNNSGKAFVNTNHATILDNARDIQTILYGENEAYSYTKLNNEMAAILFKTRDSVIEIHSQLFGDFNCDNIATAATIAFTLGVPIDKIKSAIENYSPGLNRSQIKIINRVTYYIDCYNANPSSMELAILSFEKSTQNKNRMLILGDMLELGTYSEIEHQNIVELVSKYQWNEVILVGSEFGKWKDKILCHHFDKTEDAKQWFKSKNWNDFSILLKGSRGYALEKIIQ